MMLRRAFLKLSAVAVLSPCLNWTRPEQQPLTYDEIAPYQQFLVEELVKAKRQIAMERLADTVADHMWGR